MDLTKGGEVVYLEEGVLRSWSGKVISRPTLCIDEGELVGWGDFDEVSRKLEKYKEKENNLGGKSSVKLLPIFQRLSAEDCYYVIEIANSYPSSGFLKSLVIMFDTKNLYTWLDLEKDNKKVR